MIGLSSKVYIPEDVARVFVTIPEYRHNKVICMVVCYLKSGAQTRAVIENPQDIIGVVEDLKARCTEEKKYLQNQPLGCMYTPR